MKKKIILILSLIIGLLFAGFFVPLGSYTATKGCLVYPTPTKRLHLILGDSIQEIKNGDVEPPPDVGCSINTRYILYLL